MKYLTINVLDTPYLYAQFWFYFLVYYYLLLTIFAFTCSYNIPVAKKMETNLAFGVSILLCCLLVA